MINKINIPQLRNNEFLQFFNDINNRCSRFNLSELKLDEVVENLNNTTKVLEQAYNKDNSSQVTEKLTISDGLRDNDLVGIRTICEGYSYSRNTEIAQAAKLVLHSIDRHGSSLQRLNYQAETTVIDAIVKSWEQETELTQALNKLSLNVWANELKSENENFSNLYQNRVDDKLDNTGASFTELRASVISSYRSLCDTIFAHSVISKHPDYIELAKAINLIINDYKAIIDRREAKAEKVETTENLDN